MALDPAENLDEIKIQIREDATDDDVGVKRAFYAADSYVKGAIGNDEPLFYKENQKADLAILWLTDHYYHAGSATIESSTVSGTLREFDLGFTSLILQLKAEYLVFKGGASDVK